MEITPKNDNSSLKAAIYCRLSEEDKNKSQETDDSNSIRNQKSMLLQYAADRGWEIYQIYSDDDYTGSDRRRPAFNQLIKDAGLHRFQIVLCKTQSRFTRELELVEKYIHGLFPLWGVRFVSIVDNADTDNKGNKKSRQINGLVNEWYLEDMSENIRSVLNNRRQNGYHIGAFALYGYQKDEDQKGHLVIDQEAAAVVREVFTLFAQGYGKMAIARLLNDRGIPNPTEYKRRQGLRYQHPETRNSTLWNYSAISDMLRNEMYIGNMVQGKYGSISYKTKQNRPRSREEWYSVEGTHDPVIDRPLWDSVQERIKQRAKPFADGTIGLFARKVKCAGCGYTMRSSKSRGRHYLKCSSRHLSKEACPGAFLAVELLERTVLEELNRLAETYVDRELLEKIIDREKRSRMRNSSMTAFQKEKLLKEKSTYEQTLENCVKGLKEVYLDKVRGILTEKDYLVLYREFSEDRERLENTLQDVEGCLQKLERQEQRRDEGREPGGRLCRLESLDRETVDLFIDSISAGRRIEGTGKVMIEIHWKFKELESS